MADKVVDVPGLGEVHFPETMSDESIAAAIKQHLGSSSPTWGHSGYNSTLPFPLGSIDEYLSSGIDRGAKGLERIFNVKDPEVQHSPTRMRDILGGTSNVVRGVGQALSPLVLSNPVGALRFLPGALLGTGAASVAADAMGLPEEGKDLLQDMGGIGGGAWSASRLAPAEAGIADVVNRQFGLAKLPQAPQPFRPNPSVAARMPFTPSTPDYGSVPPAGPTGWKPPESSLVPGGSVEITPVAPALFKPSPSVASKLRSAPFVEEYGQSRPVQPTGWKPPEGTMIPPVTSSTTPQAPKPFKPNPNILRNLGRGGSSGDTPGMPSGTGSRPIRPISPKPQAAPPTTGTAPPVAAVPPPVEGDAVAVKAGTGLEPIDKFEMNRLAHARAQEMELPGSPAGKNGHPQLSGVAKDVFGADSWSKLSVKQMRAVYDYMEQHGKLPTKGQIQLK